LSYTSKKSSICKRVAMASSNSHFGKNRTLVL
jgi:hypothetical protein